MLRGRLADLRGLVLATVVAILIAVVALNVRPSYRPALLPTPDVQPALPLRAAFYYPWYPEAWQKERFFPYTEYTPAAGFYDSSDLAVIRKHIEALEYGHIEAGIISWWGVNSATDRRVPIILSATPPSTLRWSIYYELESVADPTVNVIRDHLAYLGNRYGHDGSYLRIDSRFVVFVYSDPRDDCGMVDRWTEANNLGAFIVLKAFDGSQTCAVQPDAWHAYSPARDVISVEDDSYTISPGFDKVGEAPRLTRDLERWQQNVRDMVASGATFQLITTFNEWPEGTAIEPAAEWATPSGFGAYLDVLHEYGEDEA
ncbi:MAG TPA: hypothetical protein VER55_08270 [Ardenticatenaceae bacterium]|nr:hypothetical protein [Ardenticatenaceae bacterium]